MGPESRSISGSGTGTASYNLDAVSQLAVNAQKRDGGSGELTVQIYRGEDILAETSTKSQYGVAQVSESFFLKAPETVE